jgi:large subunit ribosomal protein L15
MNLGTLRPPVGAVKKRKRVGRGDGSGHGGTAGKGAKGQNARSGGGVRASFEGGQMPLARRLPKRGFRNHFRKEFAIVNVGQLSKFPKGSVVDEEAILKSGLVKHRGDGIKLLAKGNLDHSLTIKVSRISAAAREKITTAGGSVSEDI